MSLSILQKFAYGVGHVLNDLCASMWFTYLLVYYHYVMQFSNSMAGYLLLIGQVADALSTPFVGYESDRLNGCFGYGKRKSWHFLGTLCVAISFPFIFNHCPGCSGGGCDPASTCWPQFLYYAPFIVIFQFGWASTQVSHLSLIPSLSSAESDQIILNSFRYAFTVISNVSVFLIAWLLLGMGDVATDKPELVPSSDKVFTILSGTVVGIGVLTSIFFHVGTKEKVCVRDEPVVDGSCVTEEACVIAAPSPPQRRIKDWFKDYRFYVIGVVYMCTRLVVNISQIYVPLFITDSLSLPKSFIAIVPLVMYVFGFFTTFFMKLLSGVAGKQLIYCMGCCIVIGSCIWMWYISPAHPIEMIITAALLGTGTSTMLVMSLSMTSSLIGPHTNTGAFVYGAMSFTDKLSNGIAVAVIQNFHPCTTMACCPACAPFYRHIVTLVPGCIALAAIFIISLLACFSTSQICQSDRDLQEEVTPLLSSQPQSDSQLKDDCCLLCIKCGIFDRRRHIDTHEDSLIQ